MSTYERFDVSTISHDANRQTVMYNLKAMVDGKLGIIWGSIPVQADIDLSEDQTVALTRIKLAEFLEVTAAHLRSIDT